MFHPGSCCEGHAELIFTVSITERARRTSPCCKELLWRWGGKRWRGLSRVEPTLWRFNAAENAEPVPAFGWRGPHCQVKNQAWRTTVLCSTGLNVITYSPIFMLNFTLGRPVTVLSAQRPANTRDILLKNARAVISLHSGRWRTSDTIRWRRWQRKVLFRDVIDPRTIRPDSLTYNIQRLIIRVE